MRTIITLIGCAISIISFSQKVGINTSQPKAMLHVKDSSVLFEGGLLYNNSYTGTTPKSGAGVRMMWFAPLGAFRSGMVDVFAPDSWDRPNIGELSFATGLNAVASGYASAAVGSYAMASGAVSFAAGYGAEAAGAQSFAAGNNARALADYSAAFNYSISTGKYAFSGNISRAVGRHSTSWGNGTVAYARSSFVVGEWNDTTNMTSSEQSVETDAVFQIGIGTNNLVRKNAVSVLKNGHVGIGVNNPAALLHLKTNTTILSPHMYLEEEGNDFARLGFKNGNTANAWHIAASPATTNSLSYMNFYWQGSGANILILKGDGNAILQGTLTQNSDERLKKNISRIDDPLQRIGQLNGYHYQWKDASRDQSLQTGLLAQEVERLMPELVSEDERGIKSVNYAGLIPYLLESIKTLQSELEQLKKK